MKSIEGFKDRFGVDLRRNRFLVDVGITVGESFGYEPIEVPLVERAEAYDQEIVGLSPWPEWNPNGCMFFDIDNYSTSYDMPDSKTAAILIPEGTLSVTRWLGAQLDEKSQVSLPLKIYYYTHCFRNELTSTLNETKGRSFTQFGIEILGSGSIISDIEPMVIANEILLHVVTKQVKVVFRISSNALFLSMADATNLDHSERVELKEQLDTIAECKAGKKPERMDGAIELFWKILRGSSIRGHDRAWNYLIDRPAGEVTEKDHEVLGLYGPETLNKIAAISEPLNRAGISCEVDYCVVRSHEYYTGITFEIDLIGKNNRYVEIGGGGRYDRLLGNFTPPDGPKSIPCVGFAFGTERLQSALVAEGLLNGNVELNRSFADLSENANIEKYRVAQEKQPSEYDLALKYLDSVSEHRIQRQKKRISVIL